MSSETANSVTIPAGQVIDTAPKGGERVPRGAKLILQVSLGPKMIDVPVLAGLPQAQAESTVKSAGFTLEKVVQKFDSKVALGTVISATDSAGVPLPKKYPEAGKVILNVSAGPLPDVIGKPQAEAFSILSTAGLKPTAGPEAFSSSVAKGNVISVTGPKTGTGPGDTVTVTVSKGPEMIEVPNVVGGLISDGAKTLKALGFAVSSNAPESYWSQLRVLSMSVAAGSKQPKGSTITLYNP